jgi:hypothetical protein
MKIKILLLLASLAFSVATARAEFILSPNFKTFTSRRLMIASANEPEILNFHNASVEKDEKALQTIGARLRPNVIAVPAGTEFFVEAVGIGADDGVIRIRLKGASDPCYTANEFLYEALDMWE